MNKNKSCTLQQGGGESKSQTCMLTDTDFIDRF
jgi:hypothetical protein